MSKTQMSLMIHKAGDYFIDLSSQRLSWWKFNLERDLHEVKSAQTSAPKTMLARPFIK
jgi:hypothetical protein